MQYFNEHIYCNNVTHALNKTRQAIYIIAFSFLTNKNPL